MKAERNSKSVHSSNIREGSFATLRVPDGWDVCEFSEVFEFVSTNSFSREQMSYQIEPTSYFNIHYGDIHATFNQQILDFKRHESQVPVLIHTPKSINNDSFLRDGDLVIADASEDYEGVGECIEIVNIKDRKVLSGLHTIAARDRSGRTHERFRAYLLRHPQVSINLKRIATGSKVYGISKANIASLSLALPPLSEQRKIALILSTWDRAIEKTELLIAQRQQLKKALMQQLLTGKVRFKKFVKSKKMKKTKLGMVPVDWAVKRIDQIASVVRGASPRPAGDSRYFNGNFIPWLTVAALTNISDSTINLTETFDYLTEEGTRQSRTLEKGTVILANSGATLGVAKILGIRCCANDGIAAFLDLSDEVEALFLCYYLNLNTKYFRDVLAPGNGQPNLNTELIGSTIMPLPNIKEQRKVTGLIRSIDVQIDSSQRGLRMLKAQKNGLMQELLTGKVRVDH